MFPVNWPREQSDFTIFRFPCRNSFPWGLGGYFFSCIFVIKTKNVDNKMRKQFARVVLWLFLLGGPAVYAQSGMTDSQVIEYVQQALQREDR